MIAVYYYHNERGDERGKVSGGKNQNEKGRREKGEGPSQERNRHATTTLCSLSTD